MTNKLILEDINRMRTIMGLESIITKKDVNELTKAMTNLVRLNESLITESVGGGIREVIELLMKKSGAADDVIELLSKNLDDIEINIKASPGLVKVIDDLSMVLKGAGVDPNVSKKSFLTMLNNGRLSDAAGDSWKAAVDQLDDATKSTKIKVNGKDMEVGDFMYKMQDDIEESYREIEKYLTDAINDPGNSRFKSGKEFVDDLKNTKLGDELDLFKNADGENIIYKNAEEIFDDGLTKYKIPNRSGELEEIADDVVDEIKTNGFKTAGAAFIKLLNFIKKMVSEAFQFIFKRTINRNKEWMTKIDSWGLGPNQTKFNKVAYTAGNVVYSALQNTVEILTIWVRPLLKKLFGIMKKGSYETKAFKDINKMMNKIGFELSSFIAQLVVLYYFPSKLAKLMTLIEQLSGGQGYIGKITRGGIELSNFLEDNLIDPVMRNTVGKDLEKNEVIVQELGEELGENLGDIKDKAMGIKELPAKMKQAQDCFKEKFGDIDFQKGDTKLADGMNTEGSEKIQAIATAINAGNYEEAKKLSKEYVKSVELTFGTLGKLDKDLDAFLKLCKEVESIEAEILNGVSQI